MRQASISEARLAFAALLDSVEKGEEILITKRGRPVARLIQVETAVDRERARRAAARIIEDAKGRTLGGLRIKDLIEEGRR